MFLTFPKVARPSSPVSRNIVAVIHPWTSWSTKMFEKCFGLATSMSPSGQEYRGWVSFRCRTIVLPLVLLTMFLQQVRHWRCWQLTPSTPPTCNCFHPSDSVSLSCRRIHKSTLTSRTSTHEPCNLLSLSSKWSWKHLVTLVATVWSSYDGTFWPVDFFSDILALACNTKSIVISATLPSSIKCLSPSSLYLSVLVPCSSIISSRSA